MELLITKCAISLQAVDLAILFSNTATKHVVFRQERRHAPLTFFHLSLEIVALLVQPVGFYVSFLPCRPGTLILVLSKLHERRHYRDTTLKFLLKLVSMMLLDPQACF